MLTVPLTVCILYAIHKLVLPGEYPSFVWSYLLKCQCNIIFLKKQAFGASQNIYSYFKKRCQKKSKKPISKDCKVIWEFLKLANNTGAIYQRSPVACDMDERSVGGMKWSSCFFQYLFFCLSPRTMERYWRQFLKPLKNFEQCFYASARGISDNRSSAKTSWENPGHFPKGIWLWAVLVNKYLR